MSARHRLSVGGAALSRGAGAPGHVGKAQGSREIGRRLRGWRKDGLQWITRAPTGRRDYTGCTGAARAHWQRDERRGRGHLRVQTDAWRGTSARDGSRHGARQRRLKGSTRREGRERPRGLGARRTTDDGLVARGFRYPTWSAAWRAVVTQRSDRQTTCRILRDGVSWVAVPGTGCTLRARGGVLKSDSVGVCKAG